jgi:hypothetical protein
MVLIGGVVETGIAGDGGEAAVNVVNGETADVVIEVIAVVEISGDCVFVMPGGGVGNGLAQDVNAIVHTIMTKTICTNLYFIFTYFVLISNSLYALIRTRINIAH